MSAINLKIEGMHCQACVARVKRALERVDGVRIHEVQVGSANIEAIDPTAAIAAVTNAGYPATRA
jgi:copper chaperone CopZ